MRSRLKIKPRMSAVKVDNKPRYLEIDCTKMPYFNTNGEVKALYRSADKKQDMIISAEA